MSAKIKPTLVNYRRNSSDMDMSSSEEETDVVEPKKAATTPMRDTHIEDEIRDKTVKGSKICASDRLSDSRSEDGQKSDKSVREKSRNKSYRDEDDSRRSHRHRRSPESSTDRGRSHHHRYRSRSPSHKYPPSRHKHSSPRRDSVRRERRRSRSRDRSPESFYSDRLAKKAARIDKLGITLLPKDGLGSMSSAASDDPILSSFMNPSAMTSARLSQQLQKRKLLWGNKKEPVAEQPKEVASGSGVTKTWEAATFKGDNDGKMTEKFKRLMGIKGDVPGTAPQGSEIIQKQEQMFSNMEAQYQVARMATHTHRGLGLGFGTFQVPHQ